MNDTTPKTQRFADLTLPTPPPDIDLDQLLTAEQRVEIAAVYDELAVLAEPLHRACIRAWHAVRPVQAITGNAIDDTVDLSEWVGVRALDRLAMQMAEDLSGMLGDYMALAQPAWVTEERLALGLPADECAEIRGRVL